MQSDAKIAELAEQILRHKHAYYRGAPIISDFEYDRLEEKLRNLDPKHPILHLIGSDKPAAISKKVVHNKPMLSLDKTYEMEELFKWQGQNKIVGMIKVDGVSLSLIYKDGYLFQAKTRGDGYEGEDVTEKSIWISDVVKTINKKIDLEVRGEVYCSESQFIHLCEEMQRRGLESPSSPRNIVAGLFARKEHSDLLSYCGFFAFDLFSEALKYNFEIEKFDWLKEQGFLLPFPELIDSHQETEKYLGFVKNKILEDEVGIDGAVFSYNLLSLHQELGETAHHPRYKLSFKWQGETAISKIEAIEWSTSRLGIVTPVAVIAPILLSGAQIRNITLHNAQHVRLFNLKSGDEIELVRSGEVIPKYLRTLTQAQGVAVIPSHCPSCHSELNFDEVRLICSNTAHCPAQQIGRILNWIRCVGIEDLSEKRLQQMIGLGMVKSIPDLYRIQLQDLLRLPLTKEKMAQKIFNNIQKTRELDLAVFLNALGFRGIGLTTWELICEQTQDLESFRVLEKSKLLAIPGIAEVMAEQVIGGFKDKSELIDELLRVGISINSNTKKLSQLNSRLKGRIFVVTGTLSCPRSEIEQRIKNLGGKLASQVSKNTYALITNDTATQSNKARAAQELKIPIWTEEFFNRQLAENS
ncbi:MAG: NAD-dependent DNA ligase LigA [Oligoflexales bacterium]|nr:NAD-dependent DNA ligase LigA [Oligoflexales bacterium]